MTKNDSNQMSQVYLIIPNFNGILVSKYNKFSRTSFAIYIKCLYLQIYYNF